MSGRVKAITDGSVGLSALLGALAVGVGPVVVVEPNGRRRWIWAQATRSPPSIPKTWSRASSTATGGGVTRSLDSTGLPPFIANAINRTLPGGTVGLLGVPLPEAAVPVTLLDLLVKSVTLRPITEGDANPQEFIPRMVQLYREGKFPFDKLVTTYRFEDINQAFKATETGEAIKPVLVF